MKLNIECYDSINVITSYSNNYIEINFIRYYNTIWFTTVSSIFNWESKDTKYVDKNDLLLINNIFTKHTYFLKKKSYIFSFGNKYPDIFILGTGLKKKLFNNNMIKILNFLNISSEIMDNKSAARTYNILVSEKRNVAAAFFLSNLNYMI